MKRFNKFFACALDAYQGSTLSSNCFKWQIPKVDLIIAAPNSRNQHILACLCEAYRQQYHYCPEICKEQLGFLRKYDKRSGFYTPLITKLMEEKRAPSALVVADIEVIKKLCVRGVFLNHNGIWFCPQKIEDVNAVDHLPGTINFHMVDYHTLVIDAADINTVPLGLSIYSNRKYQQKSQPRIILLGNFRNPYQNSKARMLLSSYGIDYSENIGDAIGDILLVSSPLTCSRSVEILHKHLGDEQRIWRYVSDTKLGDLWKAPYISKKILLHNLQENVEAFIRMNGLMQFAQEYHKKKLDLFRQNAPKFQDNLLQRISWQMSLRVYASRLKSTLKKD